MTDKNPPQPGTVYLVGAGPGDPGLITVTGLARLRAADVVVYDALANPALLAQAPDHAQRIDVGKRAKHHKLTQDQTNQLLADLALAGQNVVRLKGGDPYLFGRGAEECAFLARLGLRCEVVPGVTSGLAAPATAGIPVTHRKIASTVTIVTGHEDPTKGHTSVDYPGLARLVERGGTACFYMGVGRLQQIADSLAEQGLPLTTPAAVVQWGTLPRQRTARGTLQDIARRVAEAGVASPAIIVVGQVAGLDEPGLDHFTNRPLFGQRVLVTRTRQQASDLRLGLEQRGAHVVEAPTLELVPPESWEPIDAALRKIADYHWLLLTSVNAVAVLAERLEIAGLDARHLAPARLAAVGDATAAAMWDRLRLRPDFVPEAFSGSQMAQQLIQTHPPAGQRCLLLRADIARPDLPRLLREAGATVDERVAYRTRVPEILDPEADAALRDGELDWVTFTSSSTARHLAELLGDRRDLIRDLKIASIGPLTSQTLRDLGWPVTVEAPTATLPALIQTLADATRPADAEVG